MPKHKTKGPLTLQGAAVPKQALRSDVSLSLKVLHRDSAAAGRGLSALVHPSSIQQLLQEQQHPPATLPQPTGAGAAAAAEGEHGQAGSECAAEVSPLPTSCFLQLASGSDCVLHTRSCVSVPSGCIQVDEVQQANLRLCPGETYSFSVFVPGGSQQGSAAAAAGDDEADLDSEEAADSDAIAADTAAADAAGAANGHKPAAAAAAAGSAAEDDPGLVSGSESGDDDEGDEQQGGLPFELTDIDVEVRLLPGASSSHKDSRSSSSSSSSNEYNDGRDAGVQVDARVLTQAFCKQCFGRVLAVNEYIVVDLPCCPPLLLRVSTANTLTAEEQQDVLGYHCYRGLLTPDTEVFFNTTTAAAAASSQVPGHLGAPEAAPQQQFSSLNLQQQADDNLQQQLPQPPPPPPQQQQQSLHATGAEQGSTEGSEGTELQRQPVQSRLAACAGSIQLLHARQRLPAAAPTNVVHVFTCDGEWFPVKKKLLRPCIALTKVVRDSGSTAPSVTVAIDTLTFDRVLIFLEAYALKRKPPRFAVHLLGDLQEAATQLGLRALQEYCRKLLGRKQAALHMYSYADVQRANTSGKVWLILDSMVLDVGRWLPEHPGGATIIPKQSLDCDCARFFEMYHASKESFLYIEEFYIGELLPADRAAVPMGGRQPPSQDFLQQLREFTAWRQEMQQQAMAKGQAATAFKSF